MEAALQTISAPGKAEFHAVITRCSGRWYAACLRITRNPELAEDAVQDALLSAWNKRGQFHSSALLETWIHRIAVNAALQLLRKHRPEKFETLEEEPRNDDPSPQEVLIDSQLEQCLGRALQQLSDMERVCFVLKHQEQWRLQEIAQQLDGNVGVIKQALLRAVKKLRVSMAGLRS